MSPEISERAAFGAMAHEKIKVGRRLDVRIKITDSLKFGKFSERRTEFTAEQKSG